MTTPILSVSPSQTINEDGAIVLTCNTRGSGSISYQWFRNGEKVHETSRIYVLNSIQRSEAGSYHCVVMNGHGNISSNTIPVNINCKIHRAY